MTCELMLLDIRGVGVDFTFVLRLQKIPSCNGVTWWGFLANDLRMRHSGPAASRSIPKLSWERGSDNVVPIWGRGTR